MEQLPITRRPSYSAERRTIDQARRRPSKIRWRANYSIIGRPRSSRKLGQRAAAKLKQHRAKRKGHATPRQEKFKAEEAEHKARAELGEMS